MEGDSPGNNTHDSQNERKVLVSGKLSIENYSTPINNIADAINNEAARQKIGANESDRIAIRQATAQEKSNAISIWSIFIGMVLLGGNIIVIYKSLQATNAAVKSSAIADSTFKEVRNEFELINRPSLNLWYTAFSNNLKPPNKWVALKYTFLNPGERSVHLYYKKAGFKFGTYSTDAIFDTLKNMQYEPFNRFAVKGFDVFQTVSVTHNLDSIQLAKLSSGLATLFFEYAYLNDFTGKWREFILIVKINKDSDNNISDIQYNENIDTSINMPYPRSYKRVY